MPDVIDMLMRLINFQVMILQNNITLVFQMHRCCYGDMVLHSNREMLCEISMCILWNAIFWAVPCKSSQQQPFHLMIMCKHYSEYSVRTMHKHSNFLIKN